MKFSILLLPIVSAYWGDWIDGVYCSIDQPLLGDIYSENPEYNEDFCEDFCRTTLESMPADYAGQGKQFCCDYEAWADNTFNCYVYEGTLREEQDYMEFPNEYFSHFLFGYEELKAAYTAITFGILMVSAIANLA